MGPRRLNKKSGQLIRKRYGASEILWKVRTIWLMFWSRLDSTTTSAPMKSLHFPSAEKNSHKSRPIFWGKVYTTDRKSLSITVVWISNRSTYRSVNKRLVISMILQKNRLREVERLSHDSRSVHAHTALPHSFPLLFNSRVWKVKFPNPQLNHQQRHRHLTAASTLIFFNSRNN